MRLHDCPLSKREERDARTGERTVIYRRENTRRFEEWVVAGDICTYHEGDRGGGTFGPRPMEACQDAERTYTQALAAKGGS